MQPADLPTLRLHAHSAVFMATSRHRSAHAEALPAALAAHDWKGKPEHLSRLSWACRYRQKRHERNFSKRIKYQCRKTLADSRPRVRGRFARNSDAGAVLPHDTKKAQAERAKRRQSSMDDSLLPKEDMYFAGEARPGGAGRLVQRLAVSARRCRGPRAAVQALLHVLLQLMP